MKPNLDNQYRSLKLGVSEAQQVLYRYPNSRSAQEAYQKACNKLKQWKEQNRGYSES